MFLNVILFIDYLFGILYHFIYLKSMIVLFHGIILNKIIKILAK